MNTTIVGHTLKIERKGDHVIADPNFLDVKQWDTLQINSTDGTFRVKFDPWPFAGTEEATGVVSEEVLTFEKLGTFSFLCFLTVPGAALELKYLTSPTGRADGGRGNVHP
jgi:hypothetical protein